MTHTLAQQHTGVHRARAHNDLHERAVVDEDLQHRKYGGLHWGTALFGWLVSTGIATILTAILAAAGSAVAVTTNDNVRSISSQTANTVGLVSGILLLVVFAIAYYAGGYVAGRMARFDGARQGTGVWVIGILVTIILGAIGAGISAKYNVLQQLNLPHLPINQDSFTTGGLITSIAAVILTLLAAITGGKVGERFHRKVDVTGVVGTSVDRQ